jgi:NAD(P)H-hydrate repair Nnr-like enzyme with NAD(P)H-hydrate epimerase domain
MIEAAKQSVEVLNKDYPTSEFLILCGPGNNGGDGYFIGIGLIKLKKRVKFLDVLRNAKNLSCASMHLERLKVQNLLI